MKKIIVILGILSLLVGCSSTVQNSHVGVDGIEYVFTRHEERGVFTPSTARELMFICGKVGDKKTCMKVNRDQYVHQDGVGNDWGAALIQAGSALGSAALTADAIVEGSVNIGKGLAKSGDEIAITSNTSSNSAAGAIALSKSKAIATSTADTINGNGGNGNTPPGDSDD